MNKQLLTLCLSLLIVCPTLAQKKLLGTVNDESNQRLSSITLRLLTPDSVFVKGAVTDDNGLFSIQEIKKGKYILIASSIGYITQYLNFEMPANDYMLPSITLKTENVLLEGVIVKGTAVIHKKDHLLIIPDKQQIKHAYSGYDLLYNLMIPSVNVDRRESTVSTPRGVATLYINGVKADFREVQNLRPKDIEKVEYYDMPAGDYLGDLASINYITKEYKTGGYISLDAEQTLGYRAGKYNVGSKIVHDKTSYTFFGGYNHKKYDGIAKEKNEELIFPDYNVNRNRSSTDADFSNNQQYTQFKVSNHTQKRSIYGVVSLVRDEIPHNDKNERLRYSGYHDQNILSIESVDQNSLKPSINLDGIFHPSDNQRIHIMLNGSYTQNAYGRNYTEGEQLSVTKADEDLYSFNAVGIYTMQGKHKNTFGGNIQHYHNVTSSSYSGDYISWQHLRMGETLLFLNYIQYLGDKFTLTLSPGGSLLNYKLHGDQLKRFWTFRTNSWIRYHLNSSHWMDAGFAIGNDQAQLSYLNAVDQTVDFLQIKRGNPDLGNPKVYDYFFIYNGQINPVNLQFNLWYSTYPDNISADYYIEKNKLISSYRSISSYHKVKVTLFLSCRISNNLRANAHLKYEHIYLPKESQFSEDNLFASLDMNYFIKSFTINGYVKTTQKTLDPTLLAFMKTPASYGFSIRYNSRKWMAEIGMENPFTEQAHYREYSDYGVYKYNQVQTGRIYQQTGYVKIAYTFDFGKKISHEDNNVNRSIQSAILKAK